MRNPLLLEKIKNKLNSLNRDELYDLLVSCGMEGLEKLESGKGQVVITCSITTKDTVYETTEINSWNQINYLTSNNKSYNLAA